jgi:CDP-glucose 4,6-dehydratase
MFGDAFRDKTVWLSGHTGFKGSWLAEWLLRLGARVHGYALEPETSPALFEQLELAGRIALHEIADVRDAGSVRRSLLDADPDFVFHLAAQPLVRLSYAQPIETYATNVMGTVHVLDALRRVRRPCAAVIITTDKCYENKEWVHGYRETDPMGGHDPYSSSKGAAEIAVASWRASFFAENGPVAVASARAGNVIGGGDWALDRIVPDCMRALAAGEPIPVRNRFATRPWQHVLEPLGGYLWLAAAMARPESTRSLRSAFNFGPGPDSNRSVGELVVEILRHWPGKWVDQSDPKAVHEAALLQLSIDKARALLRWMPVWDFAETVRHAVEWYRGSNSARERTGAQIDGYVAAARARNIPWA